MHIRRLKLGLVLTAGVVCFSLGAQYIAEGSRASTGRHTIPPTPVEPFSPSNARTEDGELIPEAQFIPAARCASCHKDTHAAWSESLHRNAGREPFYKESVDILSHSRGIEFTRHCESCHAPTALFSGALTKGSKEPRALDDEGVTCSVCHSITEVRLDGTGSYTIRRPALLVREDGTPIYGDLSDKQILADIAGHRRAVMRPLLKKPEFCAVCHKSSAPPELNGYKFIRGFSAYDEWQQSGASHETVVPFYRREERKDCRACHMPKLRSSNDLAAKSGQIASHRWLGANTAAPLFYGQTQQVELTEQFLKANVLNVDIFAIKKESTGELIAPLDSSAENCVALEVGEEITAEVVVANRNAAHSFPPELRDLYEAWVEFEALDATGKTIFHSGFIKPDQTLDESAHVYKSILPDQQGRPITRHQVWLATAKAYDNAIQAGRSDLVRFRFRVPEDARAGAFTGITLRARVNYRRFIQEYTDYVLKRVNTQLTIPVVRMAEAVAVIRGQRSGVRGQALVRSPEYVVQSKASDTRLGIQETKLAPGPRPLAPAPQARRWNDYGIALLEQAQYGAAVEGSAPQFT